MGKKDLDRLLEAYDPQEIAKAYEENKPGNFLAAWFKNLEIIDAEQKSPTITRIVYRFPVQEVYLNPTGSLHGGAIATIFDVATSWLMFLISKPGFWMTLGTTRTLNCVYLRPAMVGEMLLLEAEIVHAGKRLCLLKGVMKREQDGKEVATCEHNKYNVDADSRL